MRSTENKREREKKLVSQMIAYYCKHKHKTSKRLCPACSELDRYARLRSDRCPFMETKTFCSNCKTHCYKSAMREKILEIMLFSGPRMMFRHPALCVRHIVESRQENRRLEKQR